MRLGLIFKHPRLIFTAAVMLLASLVTFVVHTNADAQSQTFEDYVPEMRVGVAPIVSVANAAAYYETIRPTSDPAETAPSTCAGDISALHPLVRELARSLPADADEIFKYVRDNVEYEATYGLKKGAAGAVLDGDGNAFDQAQLLMQLLRANNICARLVYGSGRASLSQLQNWLGVSDVDAAERIFADGGIPVDRDGDGLRFGHVWVQLYGASGSTAYDPAFKTRRAAPTAVDLAALVNLNVTDIRSNLGGSGSATTSRTYSSASTFDSYLAGRAQALADVLYSNETYAARSLNDLFGLGEIDPLASETLTTATRMPLAAYPAQTLTWYQVPDRFRTMLTIRVGVGPSGSETEPTWHLEEALPLDVAANARLWIDTSFAGATSPSQLSTGALSLMLDEVELDQTSSLSSDLENARWYASIEVTEPYAANSGGYLDQRVVSRIDPRSVSVVFASAGRSGLRRNDELARLPLAGALLARNVWLTANPGVTGQMCLAPATGIGATTTFVMETQQNFNCTTPPPPPPNQDLPSSTSLFVWNTCLSLPTFSASSSVVTTSNNVVQSCGNAEIGNASFEGTPSPIFSGHLLTKLRIANNWLHEAWRVRAAVAGLGAGASQNHVTVGVVSSAIQIEPRHNSVSADQLRIHAESTLSFNRRQGAANASARAAMAGAYASASSALEGFVLQNSFGTPIAGSVASRFRWAVAFDVADTSGLNFRNIGTGPDGGFRRITPADFTSQGSGIWTGLSLYGPAARQVVEDRLQDGYTVFLPSWGTLGPEVATEQRLTRPSGLSELEWYTNVYRSGSAAIILHDPASGSFSHILVDPQHGIFKGGGVTPELRAAEIRRPTSDDLDNSADPWSSALGVDDRDGRLTVSVPSDITFGGSPLAYQRVYQSELAATRQESTGWRSNHSNEFNLSGGAAAQLGEGRPAHAAAMLVAIMTSLKLHEAALDIDTIVGSELAMSWWTDNLMMSVATAEVGAEQTNYYRAPNGTWLGETPRVGALTQTGSILPRRMAERFYDPLLPGVSGTNNALRITFGYDISGVDFTERSTAGVLRRWDYTPNRSLSSYENEDPDAREPVLPTFSDCDMSIGNWCQAVLYEHHTLVDIREGCPSGAASNPALCQGVVLTYTPTQVSDNLGNTLTFSSTSTTETVTANSGVWLTQTLDNPASGYAGARRLASVAYGSGSTTHWQQRYEYENAHGASSTTRYRPLLVRIYLPQDLVNPYQTIAYTADDRIDSITDARGEVSNYLVAGARSEVRDEVGNAAISWYDRQGRLVETRDRAGRVTLIDNDGAGRRTAVRSRASTTALGSFDEGFDYTYDRFDNVVLQRQLVRSGQSGSPIDTSWTYGRTDFPTSPTVQTAPLSRVTTTTYDTYGRVTRVDGPASERADYVYDTKGFPTENRIWISTATNDYRSTQFDYTYGSQPHRGLIRRVVETPNPSDGGSARASTFDWNAQGDLTGVTNPRNYYAAAVYDASRRMTRFDRRRGSSGAATLGARTEFDYDLNGRLRHVREAKTIAASSWADTEARYTASGRLERIIDPSGDTDLFTYDDRDWLSTVTDGAGRVTEYAYDGVGRLTCERRGVGSGVAQAYQSVGYLYWDAPQRLRPARGSNADCSQSSTTYDTTYAFDAFGRVRTSTFPDATTTIEDRNAAGEVSTLTNRSGQVSTSTYDNSGRVLTRTTPEGVYAFQYNRAGEMTRAGFTPSGGSERWTALDLDGFGRLVAEQRWDGLNTGFEYDANNNRTAIIWPDNWRAEYVYDELDRLTEVKGGASGSVVTLARYQYDDRGRRTQTAYGPTAGSPVSSLSYTWQDDNDLQQIVHAFSGANVTIGHGYDASGRVTSTTPSDADWMWSPASASTESYSAANALNQYSAAAGETLTWDTRGNLANYGAMTLTHNSANQLTGASRSSGGTFSATYTYDALGRRVARAGTNVAAARFIHAGSEEIADVDPSTSTILRRFVPGLGTDQPVAYIEHVGGTQTYYYHQDRLGNVVAVANSSGALADRYVYTPYGVEEPLVTTGQPFRYTARRFDAESGLYFYRARYYSARMGRFLQTDPVGYSDDLNLYLYAGNSPLTMSDPTGLQSEEGRQGYPVGWLDPFAGPVRLMEQIGDGFADWISPAAQSERYQSRTWAQAIARAEARSDNLLPLFHGTDLMSAVQLRAGAPLSLSQAAQLQTEAQSQLGFFLSPSAETAEFFALRASSRNDNGGGVVVTFFFTKAALEGMQNAGARWNVIQVGYTQALELEVPPVAFPVFDYLRETGEIITEIQPE